MRQKENPFPGLNPFFESQWSDVHSALIILLRNSLGENLPEDLRVRSEERIILSEPCGRDRFNRADLAVTEPWRTGLPPVWSLDGEPAGGVTVAEPEIVLEVPHVERWLEIRTADGRIVTVIEVLSPSNKLGEGADDYRRKQRDILDSRVNLVEIDLLRRGRHVVAVSSENVKTVQGTCGLICVSRSVSPGRRELYYCPLRERLPAIRIPLRSTDPDAAVDLQPLIDNIHRTGRYWQIPDPPGPQPPLLPDEEAWVTERLKAAGWE